MRMSDVARVGLTVLIAAVLLVVGTFSLRATLLRAGTYPYEVAFPDAQGIQEGAYVRVRGVDVGTVKAIDLKANKPLLTLLIRRDKYPQVSDDDAIRIVGGLFNFNPPYVEITPGGRKNRSAAAVGPEVQTGPSADTLLVQGSQLLENLSQLTGKLNRLTEGFAKVAEDPSLRRNVLDTASNFAKVSRSSVAIATNMEGATARADRLIGSFSSTAARLDRALLQVDGLMTSFRGTADQSREVMRDTRALVQDTRAVVQDSRGLVRSTNRVVESAGGLVAETRETLGENRERVKALFDNLNASLKQLDATLVEARGFLGDSEMRADLKATADNVREATANLKEITKDVRGLTGDPKVQEDLRATITGLRAATEEAADVFRRVRGVLGGGGKTVKTIGERVQEVELDAAVMRTFRSNRTRVDFDATIPWSESTFYRLGIYDFGEGNKFNIQAGQQVRDGWWARYGIHASKLGVGLDAGRRHRPPFSLDLYGLDRPNLDVRGNLPISPYLDLTVGVDRVFQRPDPIFGIRYRR
jgi:phospholipid/cholesterol/gamma-HCH transport system substrate-binding protein